MVLTAGLGTRLRPLSLLRAKPALPVAGVPLAGRILQWLAAAGVPSAVLNLHHLPATITGAIGDGEAFGIPVRYSWEPVILGSAGGPAHALPLLDSDRFFIINGDTLTDVDLAALGADHLRSGARVTMALVRNPDPLHYGGVTLDAGGAITGFSAPGPSNQGWHFIGAQAVDAGVFAPLDPDRPAETVMGVYREMMTARPGSVRGFTSGASFRDIGTAKDYLETSLLVAQAERRGDCLPGPGATVEPGARATRSILWDDVRVGTGAAIRDCVVCDGVVIPPGTQWEGRVVRRREGAAPEPLEEAIGDVLVSRLDARRPAAASRT